MQYDETGEELQQVLVVNDKGEGQGEKMMMTETQIEELEESLPVGWSLEIV